jgi:carotenoid cleavage dioxygenase
MGDGMLHGVHLSNGKALSYRNRWIQTKSLESGDTNLMSNLGNTALVKHGNKLLALYEAGVPHQMDASTLNTLGPFNFGDQLLGPMTAHPKIDPVTGEMFFIGYMPVPPYLRCHTVNPDGELVRTEEITLPRGVMMHDFQLTQNHVIFLDLPVVFDLTALGTSPFPMTFDAANGARIGVMPRKGTNADVQWFDVDNCFAFHTMNAYETSDNKVILEACRMESMWDGGFSATLPAANPWEWSLDLKTGAATEQKLLDTFMDFPKIDERKQGVEHRIDYGLRLVEANADYPLHPDAIIKYDRKNGATDVWDCGYGVQPDEALFVPDPNDNGEDAGWLISMVYNRAEGISEVVVLNAQQLSKGPIARVKMPRRVPFGFHGLWVPESA